jgi:hypothetical protein
MHRRSLFLFSFLLLLAYLVVTLPWLLRPLPEEGISEAGELTFCDDQDMASLTKGISDDSLLTRFPYSAYLCNGRFRSITQIKKDIHALDELYPSVPMAGQYVVATALTEKLFAMHQGTFVRFDPDTLLLFLEYAEPFGNYAHMDSVNATAYDVIYRFWFEKVSQLLSSYQSENNALKYDFAFRYIDTKASRLKFISDVRESRLEKFLYNLRAGNWAHLISATWNDMPVPARILLSAFGLLTLYAYFYLAMGISRFYKRR